MRSRSPALVGYGRAIPRANTVRIWLRPGGNRHRRNLARSAAPQTRRSPAYRTATRGIAGQFLWRAGRPEYASRRDLLGRRRPVPAIVRPGPATVAKTFEERTAVPMPRADRYDPELRKPLRVFEVQDRFLLRSAADANRLLRSGSRARSLLQDTPGQTRQRGSDDRSRREKFVRLARKRRRQRKHESTVVSDVFAYMRHASQPFNNYDVVVLDPPRPDRSRGRRCRRKHFDIIGFARLAGLAELVKLSGRSSSIRRTPESTRTQPKPPPRNPLQILEKAKRWRPSPSRIMQASG